jgi:cell division FtsZ-interacting protein ZapD
VILYEYPFNERIRTYARSIFAVYSAPSATAHSTDHHAITTILKSWTSVRGLI